MKVSKSIDGGSLTGYGCGGRVDKLIEVETRQELSQIFKESAKRGDEVSVIGGGYNTLIGPGGVRGILLKLAGEFSLIKVNGENLIAGAGARNSELIAVAVDSGLSGVEFLSGIPGTVGGTVRGNAGSGQESVGGRLVEIECFDGEKFIRLTDLKNSFSYRKFNLPSGYLITEAVFSLDKSSPEIVGNDIASRIANKKKTQPFGQNCGSVFKNPPDSSAWELIDAAGFRGYSMGGARVSEKHTNFIECLPGANEKDIWNLIKLIRKKVYDQCGIKLSLEIQLLGEGFD